jgi:RimJ/RimL family protein N-acetyltransferase
MINAATPTQGRHPPRRVAASTPLGAVLGYIFDTLRKHRASATTDAANSAAAALFARLGFRREGHFLRNVWFKGAWGDEFQFALLRDDWQAHSSVRLSRG